MPLDPDQLFPIDTYSRKDVATELNNYFVGYTGGKAPLRPDDERLTDEICTDFCRKFGAIAADTPIEEDNLHNELCFDTLNLIGIDPLDPQW